MVTKCTGNGGPIGPKEGVRSWWLSVGKIRWPKPEALVGSVDATLNGPRHPKT